MPYPYGMQSAPAVGNGLGGLPRRAQAGPPPKTIERIYEDSTERTFLIPKGYKSFRVTLIGAGWPSTVGGGGGCAQSATYDATPGLEIKYTLAPSNQTSDSACYFKDVRLICTTANGSYGGAASGGVVNNRGGDGAASNYAGGAASPSGPGQNATSSNNGNGGDGPGSPGLGNSRTPGAGGGGPSMVRIELF